MLDADASAECRVGRPSTQGGVAVKLGVHYWNYSRPPEPARIAATLAETARVAEQAGVSSFTVMDHYFQMDRVAAAGEPMLEAYTTLGHVAAITERMTLGVLVTGVMYRHPGLLAKIVTTLDVLSGGRARLGIGASWYEREQRGLGVPVVPVAERFERLEETLQICLQMWSDDDGPFHGRHYQLAETLCAPAPIQWPHPPILVGGGGEKKTLLLAARYADACNLFGSSPADVAHKLEVLRSHMLDDRFFSWFVREVSARSTDPTGRLLAVFDVLGQWFRRDTFRGCAFINAAVELADPSHPAHHAVLAHKQRSRDYFRELAEAAQLPDPTGVSDQWMLLTEGAIVTALVEDDRGAATRARRAALELLATAGPS
jgi:F420-dependent oxidoreductase-like protein